MSAVMSDPVPVRYALHEPALRAYRDEPKPPLVEDKASVKVWRAEVREHYANALKAAVGRDATRYEREVFFGLVRILKGGTSWRVRKILTVKDVMPALRPWAAARGLI